ncbi:MAG: lipocalin family protein [Melioribacteraceae bacterium]|nr:lipocalin family protein [Melioribacteraceae bacterium]
MKTKIEFLRIFSLVIAAVLISACSSKNYLPLETVDNVDVSRYLGKWYEVAKLPNSFQDDCYCATAEYGLIDSNTLSVVNKCFEDSIDGTIDSVDGKAFIVENSNNSKLKVQFFWPFKGDYWIIELDQENYSYAVVGTPSRKYLWILSRTPRLEKNILDSLLNKIAQKNFDVSKIEFTENECYSEL